MSGARTWHTHPIITVLVAKECLLPLRHEGHPASSFDSAARMRHQPPVAIQLFRVLPSSNMLGAEGELDSSSQVATTATKGVAKKGACQWNYSAWPSGWPTTPGHGCLSNPLQFLVETPRLEFKLSPKRISKLKISNRDYMTVFESGNWAASDVRRILRVNSWRKTTCSSQFLIATFAISEIGSTRSKQTSKQISNRNKIAVSAFSPQRAAAPIRG